MIKGDDGWESKNFLSGSDNQSQLGDKAHATRGENLAAFFYDCTYLKQHRWHFTTHGNPMEQGDGSLQRPGRNLLPVGEGQRAGPDHFRVEQSVLMGRERWYLIN